MWLMLKDKVLTANFRTIGIARFFTLMPFVCLVSDLGPVLVWTGTATICTKNVQSEIQVVDLDQEQSISSKICSKNNFLRYQIKAI